MGIKVILFEVQFVQNIVQRCAENLLVNILPSLKINNGPGWCPLTAKNSRIVVIGQIVDAVLPRPNVTLCLKGLVVDCFIFIVRS